MLPAEPFANYCFGPLDLPPWRRQLLADLRHYRCALPMDMEPPPLLGDAPAARLELALEELPAPDAADALALALTYAHLNKRFAIDPTQKI